MAISMRPNRWICLVIFSLVAWVQPSQSLPIVPKTFVENAIEEGAVCLDGSPAVYHFDAGKGDGAKNWMVYLSGGGWCINSTIFENRTHAFAESCTTRALGGLGSSNNMVDLEFRGVFSGEENATYFYNWNRVVVRYCDGGSFSGDVENPDPATNLYYRGARIYKVVMKELLSKGLKDAQNVILAGGSAGGLAVMIHCDNFRSLFPDNVRVKCLADSGFFLHVKDPEHAKFFGTVYSSIVETQQSVKALPTECTSKMSPVSCFFPQTLMQYVKGPLLIYNSAFDSYQVGNTFSTALNKALSNYKSISPADLAILRDFRQQLINVLPPEGYLITSRAGHSFGSSGGYKGPIFPSNNSSQSIESLILDWFYDRSPAKIIDSTDVPLP